MTKRLQESISVGGIISGLAMAFDVFGLVQSIGTTWAKFIPIIGIGFFAGGAYWLVHGAIGGRLGKKRSNEIQERQEEIERNDRILNHMKSLLFVVEGSRWDSGIMDWEFPSHLDRERARKIMTTFKQMGLAPVGLSTAREWHVYFLTAIPIVETNGYKEVMRLVRDREPPFS